MSLGITKTMKVSVLRLAAAALALAGGAHAACGDGVLDAGEAHTYAVPDKPAAPRIDTGEEVTPFSFTVRWEAPSSACRGDPDGCVDDHGLELTALELEVNGQVVDDVGGESATERELNRDNFKSTTLDQFVDINFRHQLVWNTVTRVSEYQHFFTAY